MVSRLLIQFINYYQKYISLMILLIIGTKNVCLYDESCSEYAKRALKEHGAMKGIAKTVLRVLSCSPYTKKYDGVI